MVRGNYLYLGMSWYNDPFKLQKWSEVTIYISVFLGIMIHQAPEMVRGNYLYLGIS